MAVHEWQMRMVDISH